MIDMLWRLAAADLGRLVSEVDPDDWGRPTPCEGWVVRDLVDHVIDENRWMPPLLAGLDLQAAEGQLADLPDDRGRAFQTAMERAGLAITFHGLAGRVHTSFGVIPATELVWQMFTDQLIHTWDLAVSLGRDDHLDPVLVEAAVEWFADQEADWRAAGVIGPAIAVASDATLQTRLLASFGRDRAAWRALAAVP